MKTETVTYDVSVRPWGGMAVERLKDLGFKDANYNSYDNVSFTYTTNEPSSVAYKKLRKMIEEYNEIGSIVMFEKQIIKSSLGRDTVNIAERIIDNIENYISPRFLTHGDVEGYYDNEVSPGDASDILKELNWKLIHIKDILEKAIDDDITDTDELDELREAIDEADSFAKDMLTRESYNSLAMDIFHPIIRNFNVIKNSRRISSSKSNILADLNDMENEFEVVEYMEKLFNEKGKPELFHKFCDEVDHTDDIAGVVAAKYVKKLFNSKKPIKSGVPFKNRGFNLTGHEIQDMEWRIDSGETVDYNGWTFMKDNDFDTIVATSPEGKTYDGFKSLSGFMDLYEYGSIESSRRLVKSSVNDELYKYLSKKTDCTKTDDYIEFPDDGRISDKYLDKFVDKYNVSLNYKRTGDTMIVYLPQSRQIKSDLNVDDEAAYWDGLEDAACGLAPADEDDPSYMKGYRNGKKRSGRKSYADKIYDDELASSRRINSSQKGYENVVEGTPYDDYHIDTTGMGILDVEHIINEIEGRGNQAVLTVQTSDGRVSHTQFNAKDWKEYKDAVNGVDEFSRNSGTKGAAITDVWVTEVKGGSYVRNSRKPIKSTRVSDLSETERDELYEIEKREAEEHYNSLSDSDKRMLRLRYDVKNARDYVKFFVVHSNKLSEDYEYMIDPREKLQSSRKPVKSSRFLVEDENGEVIAEADTYEEAQTVEGGAKIIDTQNEQEEGGLFQSKKSIKSDYRSVAEEQGVDYDNSYYSEFDDMVEEWGYDVNDEFTYMLGVDPDDWREEYTGAANAYMLEVPGYYKLGDMEGMVLVGKLQDIFDYCDQVWGIGLHPDYVCPADSFDYEDGEWVTGGWIDSSKKSETTKQTITRLLSSVISGEMTEDEAAEEIAQANNVNVGYAKQIFSEYMNDKERYLTSGMLELGEALNVEFDPDGNLDTWFVDFAGEEDKPSPTLGGELVKAARYIIRAFRENGEKIGWGYAMETLNPAARFIIDNTDFSGNDELKSMLEGDVPDDNGYEKWVNSFEDDFADYLRDHSELFEKLNNTDFMDSANESDEYNTVDEFFIEDDDGNQYWFQYDSNDWTCVDISYDTTPDYTEGDVITAEDYMFDNIDFNEEFGEFTEAPFEYSWEDGDGESVRISNIRLINGLYEIDDSINYNELMEIINGGTLIYDKDGNELKARDIF